MSDFSVKQNPLVSIMTYILYFLAAKATIKDPDYDITAPFLSTFSAEIITFWNFLI